MTTTARYQHSISLTEEEELIVEALKRQGMGIQGIFRKGLESYAPLVPEKVKQKAKDLVK